MHLANWTNTFNNMDKYFLVSVEESGRDRLSSFYRTPHSHLILLHTYKCMYIIHCKVKDAQNETSV